MKLSMMITTRESMEMKKNEPKNIKVYLCGHEESALLVMKILCKACSFFMKFSFLPLSAPADHP